jgi:hypothetical protein
MKCLSKGCKTTALLMTVELCYPCSQLIEQLNLTDKEQGCAECGVKTSDGYALYCVKCSEPMREWIGLTDAEIAQAVGSPLDEVYLVDFRKVIAKVYEKNT